MFNKTRYKNIALQRRAIEANEKVESKIIIVN